MSTTNLGDDWDQDQAETYSVMLDVLSPADIDGLNYPLPDHLEAYEERFSVLAGVPLNGCGLSDFSRDSPNYQNCWFKTGGCQVSVKDKKIGLTPATFLFPGVILNNYYGFQPVAGQVFTSASVFMRSLLSVDGATNFLATLTEKCDKPPAWKKWQAGTKNGVDYVRFTRTHSTHGVIPGTPSQTPKFGKPKPENKPYTLVDGAPVLPVYDCRSKQFDLVNLLKNKPLVSETEAILVPGDIVYIAAMINLSGNKTDLVTSVAFVPLYVVLFQRGNIEEDVITFEKKTVVEQKEKEADFKW
ncbi:hypothetical protein HDU98_008437 [Podochytrium sp. JEL0797]|nr:hypothetical protein HDU98_008437 [Podochytrium sp. JEL0797]